MKVTLDLEDDLLTAVKQYVERHGISLEGFVEDALRAHLESSASPAPFRLELPVFGGEGEPRVEIMDRKALYRFMEEQE